MTANGSAARAITASEPIVTQAEVAFFRANGFVIPARGLPDEVRDGLCEAVEAVLRDNEDWPNLLRMPHVQQRDMLIDASVPGRSEPVRLINAGFVAGEDGPGLQRGVPALGGTRLVIHEHPEQHGSVQAVLPLGGDIGPAAVRVVPGLDQLPDLGRAATA